MAANQPMFKVFSKKLAYELRLKGFPCLGTEPSEKFPQYDVYLFPNTPELQETVENYCRSKKGGGSCAK